MNRRRFQSDMEAAWELRPETDETPGTRAHINRFASKQVKNNENESKREKTEDSES